MPAGKVIHVEEAVAGSELSVDVTGTGATTITVEDPTDFQPEGGELQIGGVEKGYATVNDDTGVITLDVAIGTVYLAGEPVLALPLTTERFAHAILEGDEETLQARIPHGLYDRLPVGARDGNLDELELVELSRDAEGELYVLDVLNREPVVDGSFVDPATLPPPDASDGLAPSTSPAATVVGLIESLFVTWVGIANVDLVKYEVHVSTSSGFTPSAGTYAGETIGTRFTVGALPGTTNRPQPGTTYYVKIIAKDDDGAAPAGTEGAGSPALVNSPDIAANAIIAGKIAAGAVTAGTLEAVLSLANRIVAGDPNGAHVELGELLDGTLGIAAHRPDLTPTFGVDGDSGDVYIRGLVDWGTLSRLYGNDIIEIQEQPAGFEVPAPVQTSSGASTPGNTITTLTRTFSTPSVVGNLLIAVATVYHETTSPASGTMPAGWTEVVNRARGRIRLQIFVRENAPATSSAVVTYGVTKPTHGSLALHEFAGLTLGASTDKSNANDLASSTPTVTELLANAQANELVFGAFGSHVVSSGAPTTGYTYRNQNTGGLDPGSGEALWASSFFKAIAAAETSSFSATLASSSDWVAGLITFKARAAAVQTPAANKIRLYAKDVGGVARLHVVNEAGVESAVALGKANEVWRLEVVSVSFDHASLAAHTVSLRTITGITGLAVGDYCFLIAKETANTFFGYCDPPVCSTAGQIGVRFFNSDAAAQDPAAGLHWFLVIHRS